MAQPLEGHSEAESEPAKRINKRHLQWAIALCLIFKCFENRDWYPNPAPKSAWNTVDGQWANGWAPRTMGTPWTFPTISPVLRSSKLTSRQQEGLQRRSCQGECSYAASKGGTKPTWRSWGPCQSPLRRFPVQASPTGPCANSLATRPPSKDPLPNHGRLNLILKREMIYVLQE